MPRETIVLTTQFTEAALIESLLTVGGLHPDPIQQRSQVTASGGENVYRISVPVEEAREAIDTLEAHGFEKCLVR
jgi:hypothetical protein